MAIMTARIITRMRIMQKAIIKESKMMLTVDDHLNALTIIT